MNTSKSQENYNRGSKVGGKGFGDSSPKAWIEIGVWDVWQEVREVIQRIWTIFISPSNNLSYKKEKWVVIQHIWS